MKSLLLTDAGKAIADLKAHNVFSLFSYRQAYFVGAKAQLDKLADMGLGFYETDPNFPENNRFISLKEVLETE